MGGNNILSKFFKMLFIWIVPLANAQFPPPPPNFPLSERNFPSDPPASDEDFFSLQREGRVLLGVYPTEIWADVSRPEGNWGDYFLAQGPVPSADQLDHDAAHIFAAGASLREHRFFQIFRVALEEKCPFWAVDKLCTSKHNKCSVCACDDQEVPLAFKQNVVEEYSSPFGESPPRRIFTDQAGSSKFRQKEKTPRKTHTNTQQKTIPNKNHTQKNQTIIEKIDKNIEKIEKNTQKDETKCEKNCEPSSENIQRNTQKNSSNKQEETNFSQVNENMLLTRKSKSEASLVYDEKNGVVRSRKKKEAGHLSGLNNFLGSSSGSRLFGEDGSDILWSFVDLKLNPPGFTNYRGKTAWGIIYNQNCQIDNVRRAHENTVISLRGEKLGGPSEEGLCMEEDTFFKIISGLQANIAILAAEFFHTHESITYDIQFFKAKIAHKPDWIANLYFTFNLLLRTLCTLSPILHNVQCHTGEECSDGAAREEFLYFLSSLSCEESYPPLFEEKITQVMAQFHNITRLLDCLECEKCRLHGKLKMTALALALQAASQDPPTSLERNEVNALVNALFYFAHSIVILNKFQERIVKARIVYGSGFVAMIFVLYLLCKCIGRSRPKIAKLE